MKSLNGCSSSARRCRRNNVSVKAQAAALAAGHGWQADAGYSPTGSGGRGGSLLVAPAAGRSISGIFASMDKKPLFSAPSAGPRRGLRRRRRLDAGDRQRLDLNRGQRFRLERSMLQRLPCRFGGGRRHDDCGGGGRRRDDHVGGRRRHPDGGGGSGNGALGQGAAPPRRPVAPTVNSPSAAPRRMGSAAGRRPFPARRAPGPRRIPRRGACFPGFRLARLAVRRSGAGRYRFVGRRRMGGIGGRRAGGLAAGPASGAAADEGRGSSASADAAELVGAAGAAGRAGLGYHPARARGALDGGRCRRQLRAGQGK